MVSNHDKERLVTLANLVGARRLVLVGDARQLGAVDAGKRLREAAAKGLAAGATTMEHQSKQPPELTKERAKPFEMGI